MHRPLTSPRLATICLSVLVLATAHPALGQLAGCREPAEVSTAISHLAQLDWAKLSVEQVQKVWPIELRGLDCDSRRCTSIESRGRIIDGAYECSEIFFFGPPDKQSEESSAQLHLQSAVIHYTTASKQKTLTVAKMLARAAGLSEADVQKLAGDQERQFLWDYDENRMTGTNLDLASHGKNWTATVSISRYQK
jgi:hypothetical protein